MAMTRRTLLSAVCALPASACAAAPAPDAAPAWRAGPAAPYAVQEIYPALHEGGIWIAGGFSPEARGATERVIVFDLATQAWRDGPALPTPSHHVHLVSHEGALWAIGGFLGGASRMQWTCTERVLKLHGDAWTEGPALPKPIGEACPIAHQGRIHLIGGRSPTGAANAAWNDQADVDDHFVLAAGAAQWERAAPLPMARNSAAAASIGGAIHVISGRTVANGQTDAHHIYDARGGAWRAGASFPEPRGGLAAATVRGRIIAGGGEIFEPPSVGSALYALDGETWAPAGALPAGRHGHGFIAADDALYVLGGAARVGGDGTLARLDVLI
ncbi:MAG: galactose oxidase [Alphaproteobacteria bacterium]|nr:galactose oxidase [Alphaproteobacteria bacterium]